MKPWGLLNKLLNNRRGETLSRPRGFSLLEVLIALSILSITLLGFAETQLAAFKMERDFSRVIKDQGFTLLELLLSLSLGMLMIVFMLKLFTLQENLHGDVNRLSQLNRHALITRLLFTHEIESAKNIYILDNGHQLKIDNALFYLTKNNLYVKKDQDVAVELMPQIKDLRITHQNNQFFIMAVVYLPENKYEQSGVHFNHSIALRFFVKPHCTFNTGNLCE